MDRIVAPELLDGLPPSDPRAVRARRDLRRVNSWMGNHTIMAGALAENFSGALKEIAELGAGDGNFLLQVAKELSWPGVGAALLDRQKIVSNETLAAFSKVSWRPKLIVTDVFDWNGMAEVIIGNLFLHHFDDARLAALLRKISTNVRLFVAVEPRRLASPFLCGQLLWLIGCNAVTRHDAVVSIRAGFDGEEISGLWPDKTNWQLTERSAGLFSHLFVARRKN
jgi:hypothetical protein